MKLKVLAVTGGKGGVGKSTIATNIAILLLDAGKKVLLVDADVDNPNDHIYLGIQRNKVADIELFTPEVDGTMCNGCLACVDICPTHALLGRRGLPPLLFKDSCLGCELCKEVCPRDAIRDGKKIVGTLYEGSSGGLKMISAAIKPGEERSPLVAHRLVRFYRKITSSEGFDYVVVDTAPGVANPVIQALRLADHALLITEPTPFGLNTMRLSFKVLRKVGLGFDVVINRSDIPSSLAEKVEKEARSQGARVFKIPYQDEVIRSSVLGRPTVRENRRGIFSLTVRKMVREVLQIEC